jgi:aquaporin Z|mmetsp:Transcript_1231/g.1621  ORF Transcript_1231/g.1621 Transcript_1231/m.1621 type:complete len:270 (+) Transcript_1231:61-870(+)|eukprot:CAMPEP_0185570130 /NCGR_PEP_ID=MMETSP0434-20130131/2546_1 /TAXON_ID=626734 ORGANISM="Favella taraikaensis, Strain Fe Narragansett Bay" /NCGR_SAMPLE_ID=MMETSP0434 /ASSEMBLY_ACC=CAM_ASM_000379 /LENGTH=269 /DNA_ID=CAMNT_0028185159 /DNA_START=57 /DNA_END=866 /DNA_ORIENTATION=-
MEVPRGNERKSLVASYEMLGTAFFVYMILVSTGDALAVPLALFSVILIFGGVTGGHFNPAVTLGVYFGEKKYTENLPYCVLIIVSQLVGSGLGMLAAAFSLSAKVDGEWSIAEGRVPVLAPKDPTGKNTHDMGEDGFSEDWQTIFTQIMCTFVFVSVILMVKGKFTAPSKDGALLALTVVVTLGGLIQVANHHAASFNPAVTLGLTIFQTSVLENTGGYLTHYFYAYFIGPLLGGALAGIFSNLHAPLHEPAKGTLDEDDEESADLLPH